MAIIEKYNEKGIKIYHGDCMATEFRYIDITEVEAYLNEGWSVKFCRFYQFGKMCYLAMKEDENVLTR